VAQSSEPDLARYAEAARRADESGCVCTVTESPFGAGHYDNLDEMPAAAVGVSLGCGNPLAVAELRDGDTVLDLGSGGGLDVLLSARRVGPTGHVFGLDATVEMVELARRNATRAGVSNVQFLHGTIEHIPLDDESVDVVISNCVIVLSADKNAVFGEIARVLRPGGRVGISDIVRHGDGDGTPMVVDCAASAITIEDYEAALRRAGLVHVTIHPTDALGGGLTNAIVKAVKPRVAVRAADSPAVEPDTYLVERRSDRV
jgi:SAM-dependent methyltransferase